MVRCAYCGAEGKMSREHVIPKGFINNMDFKALTVWLDKAPSKVINSELMVKDVCAECNNGELSQLDAYALKLMISYNEKILYETRKVFFKYNYDLLTRWLLKVCYNSARANDSYYDIGLYHKNIDYILKGKEAESKIEVYALFMETAYDKQMKNECYHLQKDRNYEIDWFRIAPYKLLAKPTYYTAMRCILINSFAFLTIIYDESDTIKSDEVENEILRSHPNFIKLNRGNKAVLKKDKTFWLETFETNKVLRDNFLVKRKSKKDDVIKIIQLSREEIENKDYSQIVYAKKSYLGNKEDLEDSYQTFEISVDGYNDEKRELYQIKEFQEYIKGVVDKFPDLIWGLNLEFPFFQVLVGAYVNDNTILEKDNPSREIKINKERLLDLQLKCFTGINKLTNMYAFDLSKNIELTEKFKKNLFKVLKIVD